MGTAYFSAAHMDRRGDDPVWRKRVKEQAHGGNIRNSVHRAYFVEMDLFYRHAVHMAFRFRDKPVYRQHILLYGKGDIKP